MLSRVQYPWRGLGYSISFLGPRPGYLGLTYPDRNAIEIYVRPGEPMWKLVFVAAYEIGHAVDLTYGTDASREEWLRMRHAKPDVVWWPCGFCNEDGNGSGDFANVFATWATGIARWTSTVGPEPGPAETRRLARFFGAPTS